MKDNKEIKNLEQNKNKEKTKAKKKKKPLLYRTAVKCLKGFYKKREFVGLENLPESPCIIIANHSQIHGPLTAEIYYPRDKKIWCTWEMMKIREVPKYAYKIFWSNKPKGVRWFYKILSYLIAPIAGYIFTRADTLPVYRDNRTIVTLKNTLTALNEGKDIILYPETDDAYSNIVNEFHRGFIDIAKFYYSKFKKEINFVPMYNCAELKKVVIGKPIKYNANIKHEEQIEPICTYLKEEITNLAKTLPVHTVIPFLNVEKEKYPLSK